MSKKHADLSPSSADRWSSCTASVGEGALNQEPDEGSEAARLGTCGHQILEDLLRNPSIDPQSYLDRVFTFWRHDELDSSGDGWYDEVLFDDPCPGAQILHTVLVTQELIDAVVTARNFVEERALLIGGTITAEQRVPIDHITAEDDAKGTSDVMIDAIESSDLFEVHDLKLGRRPVNAYKTIVPAHEDIITGEMVAEVVRPSLQMSMYASGALRLLREKKRQPKHVRLVIIQPFLNHVSEWFGTVEELEAACGWLSIKAEETRTNPVFSPSADNCLFCRASGNCEAQTRKVMEIAVEGFDEVENARAKPLNDVTLGDSFALIPLVTVWATAVSNKVRENLHNGVPVVRSDGLSYKLVEGKMGAREWADAALAEAELKRMRLKDTVIYKRKLLSPTDAEKLAKVKKPKKGEAPQAPVLGKTQWNKLQSFITQERTQPAVALQTDPRPALTSRDDGFDEVYPADNSDLF